MAMNWDYAYEADERDEPAEEPWNTWGCCFPGECCMAHCDHMKGECYTPQMAEDEEAEWRVPEAIQYLQSRGYTVKGPDGDQTATGN